MKKNELNEKKVKIIPLGGLEKIGMNITAFEYEDSIILVDCGASFPEDEMLGIDLVIPDISYLIENKEKVKGIFITHGHEDHIGALPYVLKELNVPIYATQLTQGLIELKLKEHRLLRETKRKTVKHGQTITQGAFRVEFIKTNHSIADASALAIYSPAGIILHTGDFKIDYTPLFGDAIDLPRLGELGKKGVLAVMCDSTNAKRPGFTVSEKLVARTFKHLFADNTTNRMIVATFASNVDRVQQIINTAHEFDRKVVVQGRSMINVIRVATELGYIKIPENTLIEPDQMKNYSDEKLVIVTTGSQGEAMAGLSRMADSTHKTISIKPGDHIVFSSTPIPGNEKAVSKVVNGLTMKGAKIIYQDTHVSGHACQEEIKLIYSLLRPRYSIPIHGEYSFRMAQKELAESMGMDSDHIFMLNSGNVLELSEKKGAVTAQAKSGGIFVDGLGVGDVGNIVIRDRQNLAENGLIVVTIGIEKSSNRIITGPDIVTRGFVYIRESGDLLEKIKKVAAKSLDKCEDKKITDWSKIKTTVKDDLGEFLWKEMKRSPMIIPIIMEIDR
ncbi:ribonuclease J [Parasporobacterium paucivorans]|uniref:Ribonuclease J n=1 Tax=Parasporobacterium paucivorans DSM 15970 TaxID=1122934 RepID=A0A1M6E3P9_9FIRM|nr:ribonuclease J [Parasporobacterium paucivorans]SHI80009.1 ribonuclease J [Parasporobacterium paucivorans DSM 15970]